MEWGRAEKGAGWRGCRSRDCGSRDCERTCPHSPKGRARLRGIRAPAFSHLGPLPPGGTHWYLPRVLLAICRTGLLCGARTGLISTLQTSGAEVQSLCPSVPPLGLFSVALPLPSAHPPHQAPVVGSAKCWLLKVAPWRWTRRGIRCPRTEPKESRQPLRRRRGALERGAGDCVFQGQPGKLEVALSHLLLRLQFPRGALTLLCTIWGHTPSAGVQGPLPWLTAPATRAHQTTKALPCARPDLGRFLAPGLPTVLGRTWPSWPPFRREHPGLEGTHHRDQKPSAPEAWLPGWTEASAPTPSLPPPPRQSPG